jgi:hypothetical protein
LGLPKRRWSSSGRTASFRRRVHGIALALTALLGDPALAGELDATPLPLPREQDTLAVADLPPAQFQEILDRIAETSFDTPDSWGAELRLRRVAIGAAPGLVVRGTALLCGGTGNCQTWLFRFADGHWSDLIAGEAPIVDGMGLAPKGSRGLPDLVVSMHASATTSRFAVYAFDGNAYRLGRCYEAAANTDGGAIGDARKVACR